MKVYVKNPNEQLIAVDCGERFRTDCAKHFLGKDTTVTFVRLDNAGTFFMAVDEDGCYKELLPNFVLEVRDLFLDKIRADVIVGTAVFIKITSANDEEMIDYVIADVTDEDFSIIEQILETSERYTIERV